MYKYKLKSINFIKALIKAGLNIFIKKILMKKRKQNIIPLSNTTLKKIVTRVMEEKAKEPKTLHERIDRQFVDAHRVLSEQTRKSSSMDSEGNVTSVTQTKLPKTKPEEQTPNKKPDPVSIFLSNVMRLAKDLQKWEKANPNAIRSEFGETSEYKNYLKVLKRTFPKG